MAIPALDLKDALSEAAQLISATLGIEKVDVFWLDAAKQTLVALGTSDTPLGKKQHELGLDKLALANGGVAVQTYCGGASYLNNNADQDPAEIRGIIASLGVRSSVYVAVDVNGTRRGVLGAVSTRPEFFTAGDLPFMEAVAGWVGMLAHRAELVANLRKAELEQSHQVGAAEILTVLAHDLRNHLNPLLGRLQMMKLRAVAGEPASVSDIDKATRSVQRLTRLTEDLLDLKRLDEGLFTLRLAPVDLLSIAQDTAASLATSAVSILVSDSNPVVLVADGDRVRQVVENLVSNAVKYSPAGGVVRVSVKVQADEERGEQAILEVADEGPGIAPDLQHVLFQRFVSDAKSPGLGLGLHLAQQIVEAHQGSLRVESRLGAGSKFILRLPTVPPLSSSLAPNA